MSCAADGRRGHLGTRLQRVDGRIETFTRALAGEHNRRGQMRERVHRRRIGEVIGRHVDRLDRGDRTGVGVGDALLQRRAPIVGW